MKFPAYHMIGLSTLDTGRLHNASPETIEQIVERSKSRFEAIKTSGVLVPSREEDAGVVREQGHFFVEDILAEDNRYVFLSVGRRYWTTPEQVNFGFLFDAVRLIEQGAILRQHDLMGEYDDLLGEVVAKRTGFREPTEWTPEEREALFAALDAPETQPGYAGPNDAYYDLLDAVRDLHYEIPGVIEAIADFRTLACRHQQEIQVVRVDAIAYLEEHGATVQCELLVPERLPLSLACGVIENGKEVFW